MVNVSTSQRNTTTSFISVMRQVKVNYHNTKTKPLKYDYVTKNIVRNTKDRIRNVWQQHKALHTHQTQKHVQSNILLQTTYSPHSVSTMNLQ
jgi:hypothetical protein